MKVSQLKENIKDLPDDEEVYVMMFEKSEANDHIFNNFENGEQQPEITGDEWQAVIEGMNKDDGLWDSVYESFRYGINQIENTRKLEAKNAKLS